MIAAIRAQDPNLFCSIRWVGRKGLSVKATTYCDREVSIADGVYQVPDSAPLCPSCKAKLR